jgi:transcriptional regulator with PAS, ATPase and Fis domain
LLEAELFGYEKGAFTGAVERRMGRFEAAGEGTVFLDEIGNLDVALQAKLLRVLQDRVFERLGGTAPVPMNARILSATNVKLEVHIRKGLFREDLYYRINGITLAIPPLRDHPEDVPALFTHFLKNACTAAGKPLPKVASDLMAQLCRYPWPGNVRELKHTSEYMALLGSGKELQVRDLPPSLTQPEPEATPPAETRSPAVRRTFPRNISKRELKAAIEENGGNLTLTAKKLNVSRQSMYRMIRAHKLELPPSGLRGQPHGKKNS